MIRVMVVDDHGLVRAGLQQLLDGAPDIEVVATASGGAEALERIAPGAVDVVLMDLSMPGMDGIATTRALLERAPDAHVVVLTSFSDRTRILDALGAGAVGYLLKDAEPAELQQGVRAAARGESPLAPRVAGHLVRDLHRPANGPQLTDRERDILALIRQGAPNKVIARRLGIAEKTVKNHLSSIFQTLGVTDRTQAALWAAEHGVGGDA
jgi:DNA-binding NarL/FixJ family response regulator